MTRRLFKKRSGVGSDADRPSYELTDQDREVGQRFVERQKQKHPAPKFKIKEGDNVTRIEADHPRPEICYAALCNTLASADTKFGEWLLNQVVYVARAGQEPTERETNAMLAAVNEIGPRDPTEALLAIQMAAIHAATMLAARRLQRTETVNQQDSTGNLLNKLARTFAVQVEALKRYRSSGEQKFTVNHQHVSVTAGQAVVGVNQGGGGANETQRQSHAPEAALEKQSSVADERSPALHGHQQAVRMPLPGASREREECVPDARSASGST